MASDYNQNEEEISLYIITSGNIYKELVGPLLEEMEHLSIEQQIKRWLILVDKSIHRYNMELRVFVRLTNREKFSVANTLHHYYA